MWCSLGGRTGRYQLNCENMSVLCSTVKGKKATSEHDTFIVHDTGRSPNVFLWLHWLVPAKSSWHTGWRVENGKSTQSTSLPAVPTKLTACSGLVTFITFPAERTRHWNSEKNKVELKLNSSIMMQLRIFPRHIVQFYWEIIDIHHCMSLRQPNSLIYMYCEMISTTESANILFSYM